MPPIDTPDKLFHDGNPATGAEGTIVPAEHLNNEQASIRDLQSEMIAILTAAAMAPESTAGQLLAALNKLYAPGNDTLGALASLVGAANKLPYFTGPKGAALTDLTAFARTLLSRSDAAGVLSDLGLGEVALAGVMSAVLSDGGRLTLPVIINGARREVLIQWGQMPCSNLATTTTAFPVPFPFTCLKVVGWGYQVAGSIQAYAVLNGFNRNSFTWNAFYAPAGSAPSLATAAAVNIHYIAIGY